MKIEEIFPIPQDFEFSSSFHNGSVMIHKNKNLQRIETFLSLKNNSVLKRSIIYSNWDILIFDTDLENYIWLKFIKNRKIVFLMIIGRLDNDK